MLNVRFIQLTVQKKSKSYTRDIMRERVWQVRGPSPRLRTWPAQLRRNMVAMSKLLATVSNLTGSGIESQTFRTDSQAFNH